MRINLTNLEAGNLLLVLKGLMLPSDKTASVLRERIEKAIADETQRDVFMFGEVKCERVPGWRLPGHDGRRHAHRLSGWLLTHVPTGQTEVIHPDKSSGVSKRAAIAMAGIFEKTWKQGLTIPKT